MTYRIRNWSKIYENNQSRRVKDLAWVPVPARHDGEKYTELMTHKHAAEIFSAWILCLQVAAQCTPRGSLIRSNGSAHTPSTLGMKTRAPSKWFEIAIPILLEMSWIEEDATKPENTPSELRERSDQGAEEGTERTEQKEPKNPTLSFEDLGISGSNRLKEEVERWMAFRIKVKKLKSGTWKDFFKDQISLSISSHGEDATIWAMEKSRVEQWQGIFPEKFPKQLSLQAFRPSAKLRPSMADIEAQKAP